MANTPAIPACPYPGMTPFHMEQSALFFGREREIDRAVWLLHTYPFLAVIGPPGSGKSSLIFAGIVPAMQRTPFFGYETLQVRAIFPGNAPLRALAAALEVSDASPDAIVTHAMQIAGKAPVLVILDQFDDIFSVSPVDQSMAFQATIARLISIPNLYLIISVRADFYLDLMNSPLWAEISNHRLEVSTLRGEELYNAIAMPATQAGVYIDPVLILRLIADAGSDSGILPFLQETMVLLWGSVRDNRLTLDAYEKLVGNGSTASGLQVAMAAHADRAIDDLPPECQMIARRIFLRLVQFSEGKPPSRRPQTEAELRAVADNATTFDETMQRLVVSRLVNTHVEDGHAMPTVSIAQEALITGWPRMQAWINEHSESEKTRQRLQAKSQEWIRLGEGEGGLLDPVELKDLESWLKQDDSAALGMTAEIEKFIHQSRKHAGSLPNIVTEMVKRELFTREQKELQEIQSRLVEAETQRKLAEQKFQSLQAEKDQVEALLARRHLEFKDKEFREAVAHIERIGVKRLKKEERAEFESALEDAFSLGTLHEMIRSKLEQNPEIILSPGNLRQAVKQLSDWATRNGALPNLIIGALESNPGNPNLRAFAINFRASRRA